MRRCQNFRRGRQTREVSVAEGLSGYWDVMDETMAAVRATQQQGPTDSIYRAARLEGLMMKRTLNSTFIGVLLIASGMSLTAPGCGNGTGPPAGRSEPGTPPTVVHSNESGTISTPAGEVQGSITTLDGRKFRVHYQGVTPDIRAGDVFVSTADQGYLRRVTSITVDRANKEVTLATTQASLAEAIGDGVIRARIRLTPETATVLEGTPKASAVAQLIGGEIVFGGVTLVDSRELEVVLARGSLGFALDVPLELEFTGFALTRLLVGAEGSIDLNLEAQASVAVAAGFNPDPIPIHPPLRYPFYVQAGLLPVLGEVVLTFVAGVEVEGTVSGDVSAGVDASAGLTVGVEYDAAKGWRPIAEPSIGFEPIGPTFELEGEANLRVFVRPEIKVVLYGVVGPYLDAEPYLDLGGTFDLCGYEAELNAGVTSDVGVKVTILDVTLFELASLRVLHWQTDPPLWEISEALPVLTVLADPDGAGTIGISPHQPCYRRGEQVTLTAAPSEGYVFSGWLGVDTADGAVAHVLVDADTTVTADFAAWVPVPDFEVSVEACPGEARAGESFILRASVENEVGTVIFSWDSTSGSFHDRAAQEPTFTAGSFEEEEVQVSVTAADVGASRTASDSCTITLISGNQPPVAEAFAVTVPFETPTHIALLASDPDAGPNPLSYHIVSHPSRGILSLVTGNEVTYTPYSGYSGPDSFSFRASDGESDSNVAEVSITVSPPVPPQGGITRVSVNSAGEESNSYSFSPSISADGRLVAFFSRASNLVSDDTNDSSDIFVHDRWTGQTTRVSVSSSSEEADGDSKSPAISADGRFVAFESRARNLVPGDVNDTTDIFVHDRQTGRTERVSVTSVGEGADALSQTPSISADGRHVAFFGGATNLGKGDTNGFLDVFVHDRESGETTRVSISSLGEQGDEDSGWQSVSGNGRYVAFWSRASNLVPGDTNGADDVFVCDTLTGQIERVSVHSSGQQTRSHSRQPSISGDGRYVSFVSYEQFVPEDTNSKEDIYVHDRVPGETIRVSTSSAGVQGNHNSWLPAISSDGRYVAFQSFADTLVPDDTNGFSDVFIHNRHTGQTWRVSVGSAGEQGNSAVDSRPSVSADGRYIAFASYASNLMPHDTNEARDVFVFDRGP